MGEVSETTSPLFGIVEILFEFRFAVVAGDLALSEESLELLF